MNELPQGLTIINFSHPITAAQLAQISGLTVGDNAIRVIPAPCQIDQTMPLAPQIVAMIDAIPLSAEDWQVERIIVNPPALANASIAAVAYLHGKMGYWPPIIRVVAGEGGGFVVSEIVKLQQMRDAGRAMRLTNITPSAAICVKEYAALG